MTRLPDLFFSESYRKRTVHGTTGRECAVCGRQVKPAPAVNHVRAAIDGTAIPMDDPRTDADSLGCFPVGSECARLFPAGYLSVMEVLA